MAETYSTGYFGRSSNQSARSTSVHVLRNNKPLCNYKPHESMSFQWCANSIVLDYIECPKCKERAEKLLANHKKIKFDKNLMSLKVDVKGKTINDLEFALEEIRTKVALGYLQGVDRNENRNYEFSLIKKSKY